MLLFYIVYNKFYSSLFLFLILAVFLNTVLTKKFNIIIRKRKKDHFNLTFCLLETILESYQKLN